MNLCGGRSVFLNMEKQRKALSKCVFPLTRCVASLLETPPLGGGPFGLHD